MAIGKITGQMLNSNLERAGSNLVIDANLVYFDVNNRLVGINNTNPAYALDVTGNAHLGNLYILGNTITSQTGKIGLGTVSSVVVTGGQAYDILYTDGNGNLSFGNLNSLSGLDGFTGNNIILGTTSHGPDGLGTTAIDLTGSVSDAILILDDILGNITNATGSVIHVSGNISGGNIISPTIDAINANITSANLAISTIQANVGAFELYANANIGSIYNHLNTLDSNVGSFETYANLQLSTVNANIGAFELYANANIGTIYTNLNTLTANVGAFELYANANIGTIYTNLNTLTANVGAFELYANANAAVQALAITSLATGANANTAAYLPSNPTIQGINANVTAANAAIVTANSAVVSYVNTLNSAMIANVTAANAAIVTANNAVVSYVNTLTNSLAIGANANTAAYLTTYTGNISAGNVISNFYGNVHADIITPYQTAVTVFNSTSAIGLPVGANTQQPANPYPGYLRYNSTFNTVEFYNGTSWISVVSEVNGQNFYGDGTNVTFTLNQTTTADGILVSINGTVQQPGYAYTVVGNQITFAQIPLVTDQIDVRFLGVSVVKDNWFDSDITITGNVLPGANVTYNLGSPTQMWESMYVSSNTIYIGGVPLSIGPGNIVTVAGTPVTTYSNANVTAYLAAGTDATIAAITTAWQSNAAAQSVDISTLYSNAAIQAASINTINSNVAATNAAITAANSYNQTYTTNAVSTAINNLINSAPGTLDTLGEIAANLAAEGSAIGAIVNSITSTNSNVTAANAVISTLASIASPALTGTPTAPTAPLATSNTQIATTAFVHNMLPTGVIVMWSGSSASIPAGWYLCNGSNGTPNLMDRFVLGAGNSYAVGATGGTADAIVVSHSHTASSTTSTSISDPGHKHWISGAPYDDGNGSGAGSNNQMYGLWADAGSYSANDPNYGYGRYNLSATTGISASSSTSTTVNSTGSSGTGQNMPPYYALCYIMKS